MARRIQWTEVALQDVDQAAAYIAQDSPFYAAGFVRRVRDAARSLDHLPNRGRVVPEFEDTRVRELIVGRYRLIYRVTPDRVDIVALVHGARDLDSMRTRENRLRP